MTAFLLHKSVNSISQDTMLTPHFRLGEFMPPLTLPSELEVEILNNLQQLALWLEALRSLISMQESGTVRIVRSMPEGASGLTTAQWNSQQPNPRKPSSMHFLGLAFDLKVVVTSVNRAGTNFFMSSRDVAGYAAMLEGFKQGGMGTYSWGNHLDLRWMVGKPPARWDEIDFERRGE